MAALKRMWQWGAVAALTAAAFGASVPTQVSAATDARCDSVMSASFPDTRVVSAKAVDPDAAARLPAYCEVTAFVSPVPGSNIGVVYRLPADWNGKMLGLGGGGQSGNILLATATPGLQRGYATAQTDTGHPIEGAGTGAWTLGPDGKPNLVALEDFGHRAIHVMTEVGKKVVAHYYGRPQSRAYFQGCSTGGRQALMEVQRYPGDYDGIISGAPAIHSPIQAADIYRENVFGEPGAAITPAHQAAMEAAAKKACDGLDGVVDGIITDPRTCRWDPGELACKPGETSATCLTPPQLSAVRRAYVTITANDGRVALYGEARGTETAWGGFYGLRGGAKTNLYTSRVTARAALFDDPNFDLTKFDPVRDVTIMRSTFTARNTETDNPDISAFINHGGKLLMWHGFDDPGISPLSTIDYYGRMQATTGKITGAAKLSQGARFFLAPGVLHCRNGPGPDLFDALGTLDTWVEKGEAPERIIATKANSPMSRPLCPYPALPRYQSGDSNDAKNFVCR